VPQTSTKGCTPTQKWCLGLGIAFGIVIIMAVIGLVFGLYFWKKNDEEEDPTPYNPSHKYCDHAGAYCSKGSTCCSGLCFEHYITGAQYCWGG
jgi:hypothetical protein